MTGDGKQEVALADFGCSELVNKLKGETDLAGTIHYMAPEVFKEEVSGRGSDRAVGRAERRTGPGAFARTT